MNTHSYSSYFNYSCLTKKYFLVFLVLLLWAFRPSLSNACDQSGFNIDNYFHNGDGTFTIVMTIQVAGGGVPNLGSTWGVYWNVDADILSVDPSSITSTNGTTLDAVFSGRVNRMG